MDKDKKEESKKQTDNFVFETEKSKFDCTEYQDKSWLVIMSCKNLVCVKGTFLIEEPNGWTRIRVVQFISSIDKNYE